MKIAFIHSRQAFLPELSAYRFFFQTENIDTCFAREGEEEGSGADVYWYMMGFYPQVKHKGKLIIHEYSSASVPPYRKIKDYLKRRLTPKPQFRIYLNEYVREQINIRDEVPFGYRDMGISELYFQPAPDAEKKFDFIYAGDLTSGRKLADLLKIFDRGSLKSQTILLLGKDRNGLAHSFGHCKNILFQGAVPWTEVPAWLARARFAINYIPDKEPYNAQTSTKFLEYAAMKIPVITTDYFWISDFRERYGGNYFMLKDDLSNMTWDRITGFPYGFPNLASWRWEDRIRNSGVLDFLNQAKI